MNLAPIYVNAEVQIENVPITAEVSAESVSVTAELATEIAPAAEEYTGATEVTPNAETQTLATQGKIVNADIRVNPIPSDYIIPTGTKDISANGEHDVREYESARVAVPAPEAYTGAYIITPTAAAQTLATANKLMTDDVTVLASTGNLKPIILRPDAELVQSWTRDRRVVADDGVTLPSYTTTSKTLIASVGVNPPLGVEIDCSQYTYQALIRALAIPEYNITTTGKGRVEYGFMVFVMDITDINAGELRGILNNALSVNSRAVSIQMEKYQHLVYYSKATELSCLNTGSVLRGIMQDVALPSVNTAQLHLAYPSLTIQGNATYLANTYYNALSDIRYQQIIELWRAPKGNLNVDGWGAWQNVRKIIECVNRNDHKLS